MATQLGKIAELLEAVPETQTPLQKRLAAFGRQPALAILVVCTIVFAFGMWRGEPIPLMLPTAMSLAVAAIPEALPAAVTVMLAFGARAMARRCALVRRLPAVERLGSVSFICTDKTSTLTLNEMRAVEACTDARQYKCGRDALWRGMANASGHGEVSRHGVLLCRARQSLC